MRIAVSGASGFIGGEVCRLLAEHSHETIAISLRDFKDEAVEHRLLQQQLSGVDAVIHLAARAHVLKDRSTDPLAQFRRANVTTAIGMAGAAAAAGVARFVFVSSIGVLGNDSGRACYSETTPPAPAEPYAVSKLEAEAALARLCSQGEMTVAIVRPPLVYGPRARGNVLRLLHLVNSGWPLPFERVRNLKSFIGVTNLASLLLSCATDAAAAGQIFVASDGEDISLSDLLRLLGRMMHKPTRLFYAPAALLRAGAATLGRGAEVSKLLCNLRVDSSKSRSVLGWTPVKRLDTGLAEMVTWYVREKGSHAH